MFKEKIYSFKFCEKGHLIYSDGAPLEAKRCQICGSNFITACASCGKELGTAFKSEVSYLTKKPVSTPSRPDFCSNCGDPFPWKKTRNDEIEATGIWGLMHPNVVRLAKSRFLSGHFADAVEAAFKDINSQVKDRYLKATGDELDGVPLMRKAFTPSSPVIVLDDLATESGKNIQQGYMEILAGSMAAIRNPKAHANILISEECAIHLLMLASLLNAKLSDSKP